MPVREVELDAYVPRKLDSVAGEVVAHETLTCLASARARAGNQHDSVGEEDELAVRPQEPVCLGQPAAWIAPYARTVLGDRHVEARVVERHIFGVGADQREGETELVLKLLSSLEL